MTRPRWAIDARPYAFLLSQLYDAGASDASIARRIGFTAPGVRRIRIGKTEWIYRDTAAAIAGLLARETV